MGNKQSARNLVSRNQNIAGDNDQGEHILDAFPLMLSQLPISFTEEEFDLLSYDIEKKTFPKSTSVMNYNGESEGIFFILKGKCEVFDGQGNLINILTENSICGEISIIYGQNSSCSVVADEGTEVLFLDKMSLKNAVSKARLMDIKDWYLNQKYLDTNHCFVETEIEKIFMREYLYCTHLFHDWTKEALEFVIDHVEDKGVCLFQPNTIIFEENMKENRLYILIKGSVQIYGDSNALVDFTVKSNECFLFGDECLFSNQSRKISMKTKSLCQMLILDSEIFSNLNKHFPNEFSKLLSLNQKWKRFQEQQSHVLSRNEFMFADIILFTINLQKMIYFRKETLAKLFEVAVTSDLKKLNMHQVYDCALLLSSAEQNDYIVVIHGEATFMDKYGFEKKYNKYEDMENIKNLEQIEADSDILIFAILHLDEIYNKT